MVTENFRKMSGTFVILNLLLFAIEVRGICVNVPNRDMIEYSCIAGSSSDLKTIPEMTEKIRIANMSLPRITRDTFSRFGSNLWVLTCTNCEIREIEDDAFADLRNLQQLRLDNNHLREIKASWFVGMDSLTYLDFNYNEISEIEDEVYANLPYLVEFRISGNRLKCLNINAMSSLKGLERMLLSQNPEFQCPNAVSRFLESLRVDFVKDDEWRNIPHDLVSAFGNPVTENSGYHQKLISQTTEEPNYEYPTFPPEIPSRLTENPFSSNRKWLETSTVFYPNQRWPFSSSTFYPHADRPTSSPTASQPNSQPNRVWQPTESPVSSIYETINWPTQAPFYPPHREQPEVYPGEENAGRDSNNGRIYGQTNYYPPAMIRTSTDNPVEDRRRISYGNYPSYVEEATPEVHATPTPPPIEYVGNSAEILTPTDYANYEKVTPSRTNTYYSATVPRISSTSEMPKMPEISPPEARHEEDVTQPKKMDNYQEVQEPDAVAIPRPKETDTRQHGGANAIGNLGIYGLVASCAILTNFPTVF